jgi:hypothetical protein
MRRLYWHVGSTIFGAIAVAMIVLVGLDAVGALIDETGDITANYRLSMRLFMLLPIFLRECMSTRPLPR